MSSISEVKCPRWGRLILTAKHGREYVVETNCKTWGCKVCRYKRASYVKAIMERGISTEGDFFLITLTLRLGSRETHGADFVKTAWTRLLRLLKRRHPNLTWFKVIEATKKGTPHLHLLMGKMGTGRVDCSHRDKYGNVPYSKRFINAYCKEDCLVHEIGYYWWELTGAFVVDAKKIYNPQGAARYLGKYLVKGFVDRQRLDDLGFKRRYAMARNWDRGEPLRLRGTARDVWVRTVSIPYWYREEEMGQRVKDDRKTYHGSTIGDNLSLAIRDRGMKKAKRAKVEGLKDAIFPAHNSGA